MKTYLLIVSVLLIAFGGCKKEEKLQASTWTANGETFNAVANVTKGKVIASLSGGNIQNRFTVFFYTPYFQLDGRLDLGGSAEIAQQNPSYIYISFYYNGIFYIRLNSQDSVVTSTTLNSRVHYTLTPTWFVNYDDHSDSILIAGDFYEP